MVNVGIETIGIGDKIITIASEQHLWFITGLIRMAMIKDIMSTLTRGQRLVEIAFLHVFLAQLCQPSGCPIAIGMV